MDRRIGYALLALAAFLVVLYVPLPAQVQAGDGTAELTTAGRSALAVLALAVVLWMTEVLPFPVTGMVAIAVLVVTGAGEFRALVREGFGHDIVLFIIGVMILSSAISRTGLLKRVTTGLLFRFGHSPRTVLLAFLAVGALTSMWISDMAVAAILTPIGAGILKQRSFKKRASNFGKSLMISCAWGPLIGGVATPAGCGPNPLTIGYLRDLADIHITFGDWMLVGLPAAALMVPLAWVTLLRCFPLEHMDLRVTEEEARIASAELGRFSRREAHTVGILGIAVLLWLGKPLLDTWTGGATGYLSISFVAMLCGCLFFLPKIDVITWRQAEEDCDWGGLVLIVTGLSLGMAVYNSGAAEWLATLAFSRIGDVPPVGQIFLVVLAVSLMKVFFSSNTVTGVIVVPLLIALSKQVGVDTALLTIPAGITASLAFILVTSAPANVIPYSAGYFSIRDMAKAGLWMTVSSSACVTLSFVLMGRFVGINVF
jgi:solute carrier family 13 (sodium-dependent dicarboxylate transporter), member 2/3/5